MSKVSKSFSAVLVSGFVALAAFSFSAAAAPDAATLGISSDPSSATYSEVQAYLKSLADKYPSSAKLVNVGPSDSGQTIQGLALGNGRFTIWSSPPITAMNTVRLRLPGPSRNPWPSPPWSDRPFTSSRC